MLKVLKVHQITPTADKCTLQSSRTQNYHTKLVIFINTNNKHTEKEVREIALFITASKKIEMYWNKFNLGKERFVQ